MNLRPNKIAVPTATSNLEYHILAGCDKPGQGEQNAACRIVKRLFNGKLNFTQL